MRLVVATRRSLAPRDNPRFRQIHECLAVQPHLSSLHLAKRSVATLGAASSIVKPCPARPRTGLIHRTGVASSRSYRFGTPKPARAPETGPAYASAFSHGYPPDLSPSSRGRADAAIIAADHAKDQLLARHGAPPEHDVLTALLQCNRAASVALNTPMNQTFNKASESDTAASSLLSLDRSAAKTAQLLAAENANHSTSSDVIEHISQVALEIISHPSVLITPRVLEAYVVIQARLGRPETLPYVLSLYATKPRPNGKSGSVEYVQQDPDKAANAVDPTIVEKALDAAIEAKNLDAAIGVIESTYATKAFLRQKVLRRGLLPVSVAATAPLAVYLVASNLAHLQTSFDQGTATAVATAGMLAYVGFTGSMGLLAVLTQNDHMKRVTWAPGITLRERWLHEEERAALDKVACSFGFSQMQRFGEEEGPEFQALRQFILRKGMVLDRVELMEGMS